MEITFQDLHHFIEDKQYLEIYGFSFNIDVFDGAIIFSKEGMVYRTSCVKELHTLVRGMRINQIFQPAPVLEPVQEPIEAQLPPSQLGNRDLQLNKDEND